MDEFLAIFTIFLMSGLHSKGMGKVDIGVEWVGWEETADTCLE